MRGPQPDPPFDLPKDNSAYLYDRYNYECYAMFHRLSPQSTSCQDGPRRSTDHSGALSAFGIAVAETPAAKAFLLVYPTRRDSRALINKFLQSEKDYLTKEFRLDPAKVITKVGATRKSGVVEFWILPPNASLPGTQGRA